MNWIDVLYYAGGSSKYYTMIFGMNKQTNKQSIKQKQFKTQTI